MTKVVCDVADNHCGGRVLATGGGGYAVYTVVPRAWTLVWATLNGVTAPDDIPEDFQRMLRLESGSDVPCMLRDGPDAFPTSPRRDAAAENNARTVDAVRRTVLPLITGWGLAF
jgi:acetoin utilization protein AcuC